MTRPTPKQTLLLLVGAMVSAWLWVWLFGLWVIYDTPLQILGYRLGFGVPVVYGASLSLFAFLSANLFAVSVALFFERSLHMSAAIFVAAFLLVFLVSSLLDEKGMSLLGLFRPLWLFVLFFGLSVFGISRLRHATVA